MNGTTFRHFLSDMSPCVQLTPHFLYMHAVFCSSLFVCFLVAGFGVDADTIFPGTLEFSNVCSFTLYRAIGQHLLKDSRKSQESGVISVQTREASTTLQYELLIVGCGHELSEHTVQCKSNYSRASS